MMRKLNCLMNKHFGIVILTPRGKPLFSERNGYRKVYIKLFGYRLVEGY